MKLSGNITYGHGQRGAASLFIVITASLLMTVIVVGYVQLMLQDQRQATTNDLSQSAYDSAQAGVEDAKRVLLLNQACQRGGIAGVDCTVVKTAIADGKCNSVATALGADPNKETIVGRQLSDDERLNQAYTCAKLLLDTPDYLGQFALDRMEVVPLYGAGDFDTVRIQWFLRADAANFNSLSLASVTGEPPLPQNTTTGWPVNRPPLVRAQLINPLKGGGSFNLADFDNNLSRTLFLYPAATGTSLPFNLALDSRQRPPKIPQAVVCDNGGWQGGGYACQAEINVTMPRLPPNDPLWGPIPAKSPAFLNLLPIYNTGRFRVQLLKAGSVVNFSGVQPEVDSTGRADNIFRRVISRVVLRDEFLYPNAAVEVNGNLCKSFRITNDDNDYSEAVGGPIQCEP